MNGEFILYHWVANALLWMANCLLILINNCIVYGGWVPTSMGNQLMAGNPKIPATRPHTLGVTAPVTLNDSGEWTDASEHRKKNNNKQTKPIEQTNEQTNREPSWALRSHHEVEIPKERGRDNNHDEVTALAGRCNGNNTKQHIHSSAGQLSLHSAKTGNPAGLRGHTVRWGSQRKGGGTTITTKSQLSLEGAMGIMLNNTSTHPWDSSRLRVQWEQHWTPHPLVRGTALTCECHGVTTLTPHPLIHGTALARECHGNNGEHHIHSSVGQLLLARRKRTTTNNKKQQRQERKKSCMPRLWRWLTEYVNKGHRYKWLPLA